MANNNNSSSGIGFFGLLGIVFIILKLTEVINWEWWIVLSPIWGSIAFGLAIVVAIVSLGLLKK